MILLYGYYGERNAGDDAFTTICATQMAQMGIGPVGVLAAELPRVEGLHARPLLFRRRLKGLAGRLESMRIDRWFARGARVLVGGGSLFSKTPGLLDIERLLDQARPSGHHAVGVSIGPFRDETAAETCARLLPRFDSVGVRDRASLARAKEIAPNAQVTLTFDLAPLMSSLVRLPDRNQRSGAEELGVALCGPALTPDAYLTMRSALSGWLTGHAGRRVVLLPFNGHPRKGDLAVHHRLAEELKATGEVELHRYNGDPRAMWSRVARLDGIVAMRLHAAVFGYCTGRPVLILPYEEKCTAWGDMIAQQPEFLLDPAVVSPTVLETLTAAGGPVAALPVAQAVAKARTNFAWAGA